jgi:hypothetical protein
LTAPPDEFRTAAPPETFEKKGKLGRVDGTVGSCIPAKIESTTAMEAGPTPEPGPEGAGPTVIPPVEVRLAVTFPVLPFVEIRTPATSNVLVLPAVNGTPVLGVGCGVPKPTTIVPVLVVMELIPTFVAVKSPVGLAMRIPVVVLGWFVALVSGPPKLIVNTTTPGSLAVAAPPELMQVTRTKPPPAVGGDALKAPTVTGGPAAIGSVWPLAVARGVEPSGTDNPQLMAVCANDALAMMNIMPRTSTGINSRLSVISILSF